MVIGVAGLLLLLGNTWAFAAGINKKYPEVEKYFPKATRFGALGGKPPAAPVYSGKQVIGYVFETDMVAPVPAYSGKPVNVLVGMSRSGQIVGAKVLQEDEPIFLIGLPVEKLYEFVARFIGHNVKENIVVGGGGGKGTVHIDAISSATVTSMSVNQTIMNAALKIAVSRRLISRTALGISAGPAKVRRNYYVPATWKSLRANGAIRRLRVTRQMVAHAFRGKKKAEVVDDVTRVLSQPGGSHNFITLYYADITPPSVGRNLLGKARYTQLMKQLKPGDEAIAMMANGVYSFKGVGYVRGGLFDRVHIVQDNNLILFHDSDYLALVDPKLKGIPAFGETGIFIVRHAYEFDPGKPWTLQLIVRRQIGPLKSIYATFKGGYVIPKGYVVFPKPKHATNSTRGPLWQRMWRSQRIEIVGLLAGLFVLTLILVFQDWLVRYPVALERIRTVFLIYTLLFIGWYGLAQLSVVNVFTFLRAILHQFQWAEFLQDPLIFILWVFVAVTLLLVGRGVYCGWLCPYGAFQALVNKGARRLGVRQFEIPPYVHERLWAIKYIVLLGLFGLSLQSVDLAERYAEVEPFKTAIILHFMRSWGFVLYAGGLLLVSAFNSKFYCKYMCPLGAALAVAGRFRLFEWLKRRRECGRPCQICANECEVKAINPIGQINFNECHYCLDCQITYCNEFKCPPLVERRKRHARSARTGSAADNQSPMSPTEDAEKVSAT